MSDGRMPRCERHPDKAAERECAVCAGKYCPFCTTRRPRPDLTYHECPVCAGKGRLAPAQPVASAGGLATDLKGIFEYPVRNNGWMMMLAGVVMFLIIDGILSMGGFLWIFAIPVSVGMTGYIWVFLLRVVSSTAEGHDEIPDWPEFTGLWHFAMQALVLWFLMALCALPAIIVWLAGVHSMPALLGAVALGLCYFPMSMLALAMGGGVGILSPLIIIPSILKVGKGYAVAVAALIGIMLIRALIERVVGGGTMVSSVVLAVVGLYFMMVQARVVGLLYRVYERELGWFS